VAVLGVGHELCGDDAAGVAIVRALGERLAESGRLLLIDAGPAPENATAALRRFRPDVVLLLDATLFGGAPGDVAWLPVEELTGFSGSGHTLPLRILAGYLAGTLDCRVGLLGIQPAADEFDTPLSPAVADSVAAVTARVARLLLSES
jgi:hydrogenase 3 maturation protease